MRFPALAAACALLLTAGLPAAADTLIVKKAHMGSLENMGEEQPAQDAEMKIWLGTDRAKQDGPERGFILCLDQKKLYLLDHLRKKYSVLTLPISLDDLIPEDVRPMVEKMAAMYRMKVEIEPSDETRKVGEWTARKYTAKLSNPAGVTIHTDFWNTVEIRQDLSLYGKLIAQISALQPGGGWVKELTALDGFTVRQDVRVYVFGNEMSSTEEVISVETLDAPAGTYDPPEGYAEEPFDLKRDLSRM